MKPLTIRALAWANLSQKTFRTLALAFIVAIFSFMLYVGSMVSVNLNNGIESLSARLGADLLVVPQGEGKKIESVLLRANPSNFYLPETMLREVRQLPGVEKASAQLFLASLEAQCCTVKVQLIGLDQKSDFVVTPWMRHTFDRELQDGEVIVGDYIFGQIGDNIKFFNTELKIAGRLEPTGMGFDSSVFMNMNTLRKLAKVAMPERAEEINHSHSAVLVRVKPGVDPISISDQLLDRLGLGADVNFVFASNMMSDTADKLRSITTFLYGLAAGLWAIAAVIMFIVFAFAFNERQKEFATLRALGASKAKVIRLVLTESFMTSAMGTSVGVLFGVLVMSLFTVSISKTIGLPYLAPSIAETIQVVVLTFIAGLITCPLASIQTIWRISRRDIYTSLREGEA